jgi:hypothetical protein
MKQANKETTRVKHINTKPCYLCQQIKDVSGYHQDSSQKDGLQSRCKECRKDTEYEGHTKRMYVNGKYVSRKHPLYKSGHYKTFEGAAFSALAGYTKTTKGHVYVISNPCWEGWIKVGMAVDSKDRCNQYQTSSPFRDYKLCHTKCFDDRRAAEQSAHKKLKKISTKHKGEWFKVSVNEAIKLIEAI